MSEPVASMPVRRPRRYRVSLRAVMLLVLAIAAGLGWRVNRPHTQAAGRRPDPPGRWPGPVRLSVRRDLPVQESPAPRVPAWLRKPLGDEYFREVTACPLFSTGATVGLDGR